jgi:hypothetical protein
LAPAAEEGRGLAAKRPGEALAACDPGVSEWGKIERFFITGKWEKNSYHARY